jgi:DNA-binding TFAR19-related protein (PDSD5 family)
VNTHTAVAIVVTSCLSWFPGASGQGVSRPPAVPLDAKAAILDAFRRHWFVAIGDAHGNRQGEAFHLALIRDPRFPAIVNDILVESGNSRYQEVLDRYVRGEEVPGEALQPIWLDTTQQHVASLDRPEIVDTVRTINASLAPERRLRILLGEPPIEWERMRTAEDLRAWNESPSANRDRFAVELVRREVLAKNRRVLALYGAGHLFRRVISESIVTLLEDGKTKPFTVWTNAAAEMAKMQGDVATWPVPSVAHLRGTVLGQVNLTEYFGPGGNDIPEQWRAPLEDQFDAVLYVGPLAKMTLARPQPWRCAEPAMAERLRRIRLQRPARADRLEKECVR